METEAIRLAVVMQRLPLASRWQSHQWRPLEIVMDQALADGPVQCLRDDADDTRWLFPGFDVSLFSGEAEGYFLNINSPTPCWFIMWRMEDLGAGEIAVPKSVTLSYNEGARLMDGGELVDTVPASALVIERLAGFTQSTYEPEQKRKRKKPSFEGGAAVAQMARDEGTRHGR